MNKMQVEEIWLPEPDSDQRLFTETAVLACESNAYNPMEIAILQYVREQGIEIVAPGEMVKEYSFTNESKMMAHVWRRGQGLLIAAKGSPETLCSICEMSGEQRQAVAEAMQKFSMQGLRVLALAEDRVKQEEDLPADLQDCSLHFLGLIAFSDPPRRHIQADIAQCRRAGVRVMMITGDNGDTAAAIAREVGISSSKIITGTMLELMDDEQLAEAVGSADIFARVLPGHKMRIVRALQGNGEIVAMTGDGVNDASALKYADIGIAMGKRGSEVAREAADLVLLDDDFSTIVDSIRDGRRIYDNIRKAMVYVLAIHVPIALASLLAPMLGIAPTALLLLPFHIMLLELIIDPTCSVVLERQPAEEDVMDKRPRNPKESIITKGLLIKGLMQGLVIFAAAFGSYYTLLQAHPAEPELARSFALAIIIIANLFLVQVNSSYQQSAWQTMKKLRQDKVVRGSIIATCLMLGIILYSPLNGFLKLAPLGLVEMLLVIVIASASVLWYEVVKLIRRQRNAFPQTNNML
jgi:Ca2+-transporting ATPase